MGVAESRPLSGFESQARRGGMAAVGQARKWGGLEVVQVAPTKSREDLIGIPDVVVDPRVHLVDAVDVLRRNDIIVLQRAGHVWLRVEVHKILAQAYDPVVGNDIARERLPGVGGQVVRVRIIYHVISRSG